MRTTSEKLRLIADWMDTIVCYTDTSNNIIYFSKDNTEVQNDLRFIAALLEE